MERREFLERIGQAMTLAMAPAAVGCGTVRGPDLEGFAESSGRSVVEVLDAQLREIRQAGHAPRIGTWLEERGYSPDLLSKLLATLWVTSTFRDLPRKTQRRPEVQAWMKDQVPVAAETTYELADLLEGLTDEEREGLARTVEEEPELVQSLLGNVGQRGRDRGVEPERIDQAKEISDHLQWRMRTQSFTAVLDDYVARVDRLCRRNGVDRATWREDLARERVVWDALKVAGSAEAAEAFAPEVDPDLIDSLSRSGAHLGVALEPGRPGCCEVAHVRRDTPAARAGLQAGDRITSIDGQSLGALETISWLSTQAPGRSVPLLVERDGEELALTATLDGGPGDRVFASRRLRKTDSNEVKTTTTGAKILGVGVRILAVGAGSLLLGLIIIAASGGIDSGFAFGLGAVLTIGGVIVMALGVIILLVGAIWRLGEVSGGGGDLRRRPRPAHAL